jgi:hypothetical protein
MKGVYLVTRTVWILEVARQKESRWRTDNLRAGGKPLEQTEQLSKSGGWFTNSTC